MNKLNLLFRKRIGITEHEVITFVKLDKVLEKTAKAIPFENLCIMENRITEITKESVINKILEQNEGGLCYELNAILYLFLKENHFSSTLIRAVVYDNRKQQWSATGKTHVTNLINHNGQVYLVDTGFGGNLPLKPVPLNGKTVESETGEFRVEQVESEHGDYILYLKLMHKDEDWKIGYAFRSNEGFHDITNLNEVQKIIIDHPGSAFNKKPLLTKITEKGNIILTDSSFTEWKDGKMKKEEIDEKRFSELRKSYFNL